METRTIAIGDIHGCAAALSGLIAAIDVQHSDTLVVLGDVIDRGDQSRESVELLIELQDRCRIVLILGNHEKMLLDVWQRGHSDSLWLACGGDTTVLSYAGSLDNAPQSHRQFLESAQMFYQSDSHFFIHANYVADLPLESQPVSVAIWEHLSRLVPPPHQSGKCAVVGHTPQKTGEILDLGHLICLDTYCVGGKWLSALDVGTGQLWQADRQGNIR